MSFSGFRSQLLDQLFPLERVPRGAELHLQQPLLAGDGVEEPAVRFLRRANLDHAPLAPIGLGEQIGIALGCGRSTSARMRPSQRQGLPVRPTRSTVCQRRPSISQGIRASPPISVMSRSPSRAAASRRSRTALRSTNGPAASTGARAWRCGKQSRGQSDALPAAFSRPSVRSTGQRRRPFIAASAPAWTPGLRRRPYHISPACRRRPRIRLPRRPRARGRSPSRPS